MASRISDWYGFGDLSSVIRLQVRFAYRPHGDRKDPSSAAGRSPSRMRRRTDEAYARFQQVVLAAVDDVEAALSGLDAARSRRDLLRASAGDAAAVAADTRHRADLGTANQSNIVAADQAQAVAAASLAAQEATVRASWVTLIQALGGGVVATSPQTAPSSHAP